MLSHSHLVCRSLRMTDYSEVSGSRFDTDLPLLEFCRRCFDHSRRQLVCLDSHRQLTATIPLSSSSSSAKKNKIVATSLIVESLTLASYQVAMSSKPVKNDKPDISSEAVIRNSSISISNGLAAFSLTLITNSDDRYQLPPIKVIKFPP